MLARGATRLEMTAAAAAAVVTTATTRHRAAIAISHPRRKLPGGHGGLRRGRRDFGHVRRRRRCRCCCERWRLYERLSDWREPRRRLERSHPSVRHLWSIHT